MQSWEAPSLGHVALGTSLSGKQVLTHHWKSSFECATTCAGTKGRHAASLCCPLSSHGVPLSTLVLPSQQGPLAGQRGRWYLVAHQLCEDVQHIPSVPQSSYPSVAARGRGIPSLSWVTSPDPTWGLRVADGIPGDLQRPWLTVACVPDTTLNPLKCLRPEP